jgi:hypothetical protein
MDAQNQLRHGGWGKIGSLPHSAYSDNRSS